MKLNGIFLGLAASALLAPLPAQVFTRAGDVERWLVTTGIARNFASGYHVAAGLPLGALAMAIPKPLARRHAAGRSSCAVMAGENCSCPCNCEKPTLTGALCPETPVPGRLGRRAMLGRCDGGAPIRSARNGCPTQVRKPH